MSDPPKVNVVEIVQIDLDPDRVARLTDDLQAVVNLHFTRNMPPARPALCFEALNALAVVAAATLAPADDGHIQWFVNAVVANVDILRNGSPLDGPTAGNA